MGEEKEETSSDFFKVFNQVEQILLHTLIFTSTTFTLTTPPLLLHSHVPPANSRTRAAPHFVNLPYQRHDM